MCRHNNVGILLITLLILPGCFPLTSLMYEKSDDFDLYTEKVSSILISTDNKSIVVIGQAHHYIFSAPSGLIKMLQSPIRQHLSADFGAFEVDEDENITGILTLRAPQLDPRARGEAIALGLKFRPKASSAQQWWNDIKLKGVRYRAGSFPPYAKSLKLKKTYSVPVTANVPKLGKVSRAALTPLTIAADGTGFIGGIALSPFLLPFLYFNPIGIPIGP